jgi:hypothetical protein
MLTTDNDRLARLRGVHERWRLELARVTDFDPDHALHLNDALHDLEILMRRLASTDGDGAIRELPTEGGRPESQSRL